MTLRQTKHGLAYDQLTFLGHVVSDEGVHPDPAKTADLAEFPRSSDEKAFRGLLGICAVYRRFIQNFARHSAPLRHLTKDVGYTTTWERRPGAGIQGTQGNISVAILSRPLRSALEKEIQTDASNTANGAVLVQQQQGPERVIA